jgi:hypothetical protein
MPLVNFRKKFHFFSFDFCQNFEVRTVRIDGEYAEPNFFGEVSKKFFPKMFTWPY